MLKHYFQQADECWFTRMDLRQLEAFIAVMTTGSMTSAGQLLGRSQSTVTRLIQELEQELRFNLFERNGPKVTPTPQAFRLHHDAENVLHGMRGVERQIQNISEGNPRELNIVASPNLAMGLVPAALGQVSRAHLPRRISLRYLSPIQVIEAVLSKTVDLGITGDLPMDHRGADLQWLGEAGCVAVLPAGAPLAQSQALSIEALAGESLITLFSHFRVSKRISTAFHQEGVLPPTTVFETNSSLSAMQMVRAGLGIAVVDPLSAHGLSLDGVVVRPLTVHIPYYFGVITAHGSPVNPTVDLLISTLSATCEALLPDFILHAPKAYEEVIQNFA